MRMIDIQKMLLPFALIIYSCSMGVALGFHYFPSRPPFNHFFVFHASRVIF